MNSFNIINGNIICPVNSKREIESLTIKNGKIFNINQTDSSLDTINLKGNTLIPGFTDSHFHLKNLGKRLEQLQLKGVKSPHIISEMVIEQSRKIPPDCFK